MGAGRSTRPLALAHGHRHRRRDLCRPGVRVARRRAPHEHRVRAVARADARRRRGRVRESGRQVPPGLVEAGGKARDRDGGAVVLAVRNVAGRIRGDGDVRRRRRQLAEHGRPSDSRYRVGCSTRSADDEIVIDEDTAKQLHLGIGDVGDVHAYGAHQDDTSGEPPTGVQLHLKVVGIVRSTQQFLFTPMVFLSPGVLAQHRDDMLWIENAFVRLRPGAGGVAALQKDANDLIASGTPVLDLRAVQRRVEHDAERRAIRARSCWRSRCSRPGSCSSGRCSGARRRRFVSTRRCYAPSA